MQPLNTMPSAAQDDDEGSEYMSAFNVADGGVSDSWDLDVLGCRWDVLCYENARRGVVSRLRWGYGARICVEVEFRFGFLGDVRWGGGLCYDF